MGTGFGGQETLEEMTYDGVDRESRLSVVENGDTRGV